MTFSISSTDTLLSNILDTSINGIVVVEAIQGEQQEIIDFRYVFVNRAAREQASILNKVAVGVTMTKLLSADDFAGVLPVLKMVWLTGHPYQGERYYSDLDEWYKVHFARLDDCHLVITFINITEERQQQYTLQKMNRDLKQSNENLQQFAYIASHDLQEPLRKITSFGNLLKSQFGEELGPTGADLIDRMQGASTRMTALIHDLLTYSRLTTHQQTFQPVSLGKLLDELFDDLGPLLDEGKASVECSDLPTVRGDASQLRQLFQNLLINAVKFRHVDRPVRIRVDCQILPGAEVPAGLPPQHEYVAVSVSDNGIGFDERYTERIFQMFQRLHGRTQYTGTGVGLAICKRVVENHQGLITANATPGEGASFRVVLPV